MIMMFSGTTAPTGWVLCNNSTEAQAANAPDLRDRFIIGAGNSYNLNATGGSADATLVSHSHTTNSTIEEGSANTKSLTGSINGISESFQQGGGSASGVFTKVGGNNLSQTASQHSDSGNCGGVDFDGSHRHTTDPQGSPAANANLPPYYALAFIMKT